MIKLGYIKIVSGKDSGRIGRLVGYDEQGIKAKVAFGYENDVVPYFNYKYYSFRNLSYDITKQNLIDRYFQISQDLRGHPQIKKNSTAHMSIISEFNIVRFLLQGYFCYEKLKKEEKEKNIILFSSFLDTLWVNEFALDLELKGFHVAIVNHELYINNNEELNNKIMQHASHYIFIESQHEYKKDTYGEYSYFYEALSKYQTLSVIVVDKSERNEKKGFYYLGDVFSEDYESGLCLLARVIDDPESLINL